MKVALIIVFRGVPLLFSYIIPSEISEKYKKGTHVSIPLGKAKAIGCIVDISEVDGQKSLKSIIDIEKDYVDIKEDIIDLIQWFWKYYQCTPFKAYQTIVGKRKLRELKEEKIFQAIPSPHTLNSDQHRAYDRIIASTSFECHVIHGVTGSGKTEIYMRLADWVIKQGKTIVICCPEISLTPQYTQQFTQRFGNTVSVIHSGLTPKKRDEAYTRIIQHLTPIVIGPRSAIFSPLDNLGMIIIDEEHDASYKQENHPRYYTHTVAAQRCKTANIPLVLGSATPSLETFSFATQAMFKSEQTIYHQVNKRASGVSMPSMQLVDMTMHKDKRQLLSKELISAIQSCIEKNQKVIILMNRRGYCPYISCQKCGEVHVCKQCQLSFTYHKDKTFRCHRCDIKVPMTHKCESCNTNSLAFGGQAIQKVEQELEHFFPDHSIIRLDKDTAKSAKDMEVLIDEFRQRGQILLGTQLIAKGHHIEDVHLVGVLGIDTQLNIPDFRSSERTFQLLMQVAGRAGRGKEQGQVVVQTQQCNHYAIQCAKDHNIQQFMETENSMRSALQYPPYVRLTNVVVSCRNESVLKTYSQSLQSFLDQQELSDISWIGPKPAPFEKVRNHFRYHIVFKHQKESEQIIKDLLLRFPIPPKYCRVLPDFDPQQLL